MTERATEGYISALLGRVDGTHTGAAPRIAPYFASETATGQPELEEVTRERRMSAASDADAGRSDLREHKATATPHDTSHQTSDDRGRSSVGEGPTDVERSATSNGPLMPSTAQHALQQTDIGAGMKDSAPKSSDFESDTPRTHHRPTGSDTDASRPKGNLAMTPLTDLQPPASDPVSDAAPSDQDNRSDPLGLRPADLEAQIAEAIASLRGEAPGFGPGTKAEKAERAERRTTEPSEPHAARSNDPAEHGTEPTNTEPPIHIHIGEIVVAPDPGQRPLERPARQTTWEPKLSLDAYRDARRKGAR